MKNEQTFFFAAKEAFSLISRLDGRAIRSNVNLLHGNVEMWTRNENDPNQLWVASDYGQQFINVGTNLPLAAGIGKSWIWDKEGMVLKNARKPNEVMDRGWKQEDGKSIGTFGRHNGTNQLFINTLDTFSTSVLGKVVTTSVLGKACFPYKIYRNLQDIEILAKYCIHFYSRQQSPTILHQKQIG